MSEKLENMQTTFVQIRDAEGVKAAISYLREQGVSLDEVVAILQAERYHPLIETFLGVTTLYFRSDDHLSSLRRMSEMQIRRNRENNQFSSGKVVHFGDEEFTIPDKEAYDVQKKIMQARNVHDNFVWSHPLRSWWQSLTKK